MEFNNLPSFEDDTEVKLYVDDIEETSTEDPTNDSDDLDDEEDHNESEPSNDEADSLAKATYEQLVEKGILDKDETFDGTFDFIESKFEELPQKLLRSAIEDLPKHSQAVLKYIAAAGSDLDESLLKDYMRAYLSDDDQPDISTNDSARSFLENHLKSQGLRNSAIQAQLDELEDSNELISEAEKLLESKPKKSDQILKAEEERQAELAKNQKEFITEVKRTLNEDLSDWSKDKKTKIIQHMPKANATLNEIAKNPKAYVQLIDLLTLFNGKEFDLEVFKVQGESRTASTLKDKITKSGFTSNKTVETAEIPDPVENLLKKGFKPVV